MHFRVSEIGLQSLLGGIKDYLDLRPFITRRHYIRTGSLRYLDFVCCDIQELETQVNAKSNHADGRIIIPLCETAEEGNLLERFALNLTGRMDTIIARTELPAYLARLVQEVERWTWVQTNAPELKADRYAAERGNRQPSLTAQTLANAPHPHERLRRETDCCYNQWEYQRSRAHSNQAPLKAHG
jgi:hypothetical protein